MKKTALFLSLAFIGTGSALAADPATIDWGKVPVVTVPLFYPGQSSYEWLLSDAHKGAAKETRRGDACTSARRAIAIFEDSARRRTIGEFDLTRTLPDVRALATTVCG